MAESELVEKIVDIVVKMPAPEVPWEDVARAAIKAVLEEGRHRAVDRRERAFVDAIARANGIDLEQS